MTGDRWARSANRSDAAGTTSTALLSARSGRIKAARALLRRDKRLAACRFLAEGPQAVREALARRDTVGELYVTPDAAARHADIVDTARAAGIPVGLGDDAALASLSGTTTPQGLVAVCATVDVPLAAAFAARPRLAVVLVRARDPGNAGTVLRTADAAGAGALVLTAESVDVYNPKCVRASAGSVFHLPVSQGAPVADVIAALRAAGLRVLAADGAGEADLDDELDAGRLAAPTAWLFGNEAWGLDDDALAAADGVVRVPIHGGAESLNLAAAAAVCLYATARAQRRTG